MVTANRLERLERQIGDIAPVSRSQLAGIFFKGHRIHPFATPMTAPLSFFATRQGARDQFGSSLNTYPIKTP
jgi:hypothetical protein